MTGLASVAADHRRTVVLPFAACSGVVGSGGEPRCGAASIADAVSTSLHCGRFVSSVSRESAAGLARRFGSCHQCGGRGGRICCGCRCGCVTAGFAGGVVEARSSAIGARRVSSCSRGRISWASARLGRGVLSGTHGAVEVRRRACHHVRREAGTRLRRMLQCWGSCRQRARMLWRHARHRVVWCHGMCVEAVVHHRRHRLRRHPAVPRSLTQERHLVHHECMVLRGTKALVHWRLPRGKRSRLRL